MFQSLSKLTGVVALTVAAFGCSQPEGAGLQNATGEPPTSAVEDGYTVKIETTKGDVLIEVHPEWAPYGAERFRELVDAKFYDGCKFFRVLDGFMAQTGINPDPSVHAQWKDRNIQDDPVKQSNLPGYVTFAKTGLPNSRSTQFFINYGDNANLDEMSFAPFGKVVQGMDVVEALYSDYGEGVPRGNGPAQEQIVMKGNAYLERDFPKLDAIQTARIISDSDDKDAAPAVSKTDDQVGDEKSAEKTSAK